ncbi:MAG: hypothetical protein IJI97_05940 [Clostridia bacterium]|nr:hypothetical protein [Clostridia bacterium]
MSFSMSVTRRPGVLLRGEPETVRIYGSDEDAGEDGFPVIVERGLVSVFRDGPEVMPIKGYRPTETSWTPLAFEWVISAEKIEEGED